MFKQQISVQFISDWQVGSGLGDGHLADTMLARDHDGIPILPGRALKGALREGAWRLALCRQDLQDAEKFLWGGTSDTTESNTPGKLRVSPGRLPQDIQQILREQPLAQREIFVRDMTCNRAQTAIDAKHMVVKHSLRSLECGIPGLVFEAYIEVYAPEVEHTWLQHYLRAICAAVKSMGANRARGLGQCRITLGHDTGAIQLPPLFSPKLSPKGNAA